MVDESNVALTADEQAFFDSGGEKEITTAELPADAGQQPVTDEQNKPKPDEQQTQAERDEKGRFVPHQALHAEREEHKKTKAQVEELRQFKAVMEDRWKTLLSAGAQKEQPQEPAFDPNNEPDPNVDIFGHAAWLKQYNDWQKTQLSTLAEKISAREQQEQEQQQEQAIWGEWQQSVATFSTEKADFADAAKFLSDTRERQLAAMASFYPALASPQGRVQQINQELKQIIAAAKEAGVPPAQAVYNMATEWGYPGTQGTQQQQTQEAPRLELPDSLKRVAAAQDASKTVGQVNGRSGGDEITPQAIAAMSAQEFEAWVKVPANERLFNRMMGA